MWDELSTEEFPLRGQEFFMEGKPDLPALFEKKKIRN